MEKDMIEMLDEYKRESCGACPEDFIFLYVDGKPLSFKQARDKIISGNKKFIEQVF